MQYFTLKSFNSISPPPFLLLSYYKLLYTIGLFSAADDSCLCPVGGGGGGGI